jgi:hypothetical protein
MAPQIGLDIPGSGKGLVATSCICKNQVQVPEVVKKKIHCSHNGGRFLKKKFCTV